MAGIKALRKLQLYREAASGTAGAATTTWRGEGTIEDQREVVFPAEDVGYISGLDRSYTPKLLAALTMDSTPATYEQLPHVLEAGVKLVGTGAADGVGSGKIYAYTFPTTAKNTIKTYTIEGGDDQEAERMSYGFVSDFTLSGRGGEAWMVEANWLGRQVLLNAFTGGVAIPSVEEVIFGKGSLYIDAVSGTIGATLKSNTLLEASLAVKTGWAPVFTDGGQKYFSFAKLTQPELLLTVTFEHDAISAAAKVDWRADTSRLIRINVPGSTLGTAGTSFTTKVMRIDVAGRWENFDKIDERDGNDIVQGVFRARYNATEALFAEIKIVNELATIP